MYGSIVNSKTQEQLRHKKELMVQKNKKNNAFQGHTKIDLVIEYGANRSNAKHNRSEPRKHAHAKRNAA